MRIIICVKFISNKKKTPRGADIIIAILAENVQNKIIYYIEK